ncbi:MAG: hypothetical protein ACR2H3_07125 [Acidimicrobiales bacterium]
MADATGDRHRDRRAGGLQQDSVTQRLDDPTGVAQFGADRVEESVEGVLDSESPAYRFSSGSAFAS